MRIKVLGRGFCSLLMSQVLQAVVHIRGSMVRASEASYEEVDLVLPGNGRLIFLNLTESLD
jgi:hypothetical protein